MRDTTLSRCLAENLRVDPAVRTRSKVTIYETILKVICRNAVEWVSKVFISNTDKPESIPAGHCLQLPRLLGQDSAKLTCGS